MHRVPEIRRAQIGIGWPRLRTVSGGRTSELEGWMAVVSTVKMVQHRDLKPYDSNDRWVVTVQSELSIKNFLGCTWSSILIQRALHVIVVVHTYHKG